MEIHLRTNIPSIEEDVLRPMLLLYLLSHGVGMMDEMVYKLVILPSLWERVQYPYLRTRKLPCKNMSIQKSIRIDIDHDSLPVGLERYGYEIDTLPYTGYDYD